MKRKGTRKKSKVGGVHSKQVKRTGTLSSRPSERTGTLSSRPSERTGNSKRKSVRPSQRYLSTTKKGKPRISSERKDGALPLSKKLTNNYRRPVHRSRKSPPKAEDKVTEAEDEVTKAAREALLKLKKVSHVSRVPHSYPPKTKEIEEKNEYLFESLTKQIGEPFEDKKKGFHNLGLFVTALVDGESSAVKKIKSIYDVHKEPKGFKEGAEFVKQFLTDTEESVNDKEAIIAAKRKIKKDISPEESFLAGAKFYARRIQGKLAPYYLSGIDMGQPFKTPPFDKLSRVEQDKVIRDAWYRYKGHRGDKSNFKYQPLGYSKPLSDERVDEAWGDPREKHVSAMGEERLINKGWLAKNPSERKYGFR